MTMPSRGESIVMRMNRQPMRRALLCSTRHYGVAHRRALGQLPMHPAGSVPPAAASLFACTRQGAPAHRTPQELGHFPMRPPRPAAQTARMALETVSSPPGAAVGQTRTIDPTSPLREMGPVDYLVV